MRGSVRTVSIDAFDTLLFFTGGLIFAVFVFRRELLNKGDYVRHLFCTIADSCGGRSSYSLHERATELDNAQ